MGGIALGFAPLVLCQHPVQHRHTQFSHFFKRTALSRRGGQTIHRIVCISARSNPLVSICTNKRATVQDDCPFAWRKRWDSNPCDLAVNRISSAARYDHFDTFPYLLYYLFSNILLYNSAPRGSLRPTSALPKASASFTPTTNSSPNCLLNASCHFDTFPCCFYLMLLHYNILFVFLQHLKVQKIAKIKPCVCMAFIQFRQARRVIRQKILPKQ